jgi:hypothetical protein
MKSLPSKQGCTAILAGLLMLLVEVRATTVAPTTFSEIVAQAEMIVTGRVLARRCEWKGLGSERRIVTVVTMEVQAAHKGTPPARMELIFLGGTVGDTTLEVAGVPQFQVGERSILFVEKNGRKFCPLAGIYHGKLTIERDARTGREILVRHNRRPLTDVREVGSDEGLVARAAAEPQNARQPLTVDEFASQIRQQLTKSSP